MEKLNTKEVEIIGFVVLNENQIHVEIANKGTILFELNDTKLNGVICKDINEFVKELENI